MFIWKFFSLNGIVFGICVNIVVKFCGCKVKIILFVNLLLLLNSNFVLFNKLCGLFVISEIGVFFFILINIFICLFGVSMIIGWVSGFLNIFNFVVINCSGCLLFKCNL